MTRRSTGSARYSAACALLMPNTVADPGTDVEFDQHAVIFAVSVGLVWSFAFYLALIADPAVSTRIIAAVPLLGLILKAGLGFGTIAPFLILTIVNSFAAFLLRKVFKGFTSTEDGVDLPASELQKLKATDSYDDYESREEEEPDTTDGALEG